MMSRETHIDHEDLALTWLLDRHGITVYDLASKAGLPQRRIRQVYRGATPSGVAAAWIVWGLNQILPFHVEVSNLWNEHHLSTPSLLDLKTFLRRNQISTTELGEQIGCHHTTVVRILNGNYRPTSDLGHAFCAEVGGHLGLAIRPERLWGGRLRTRGAKWRGSGEVAGGYK